MKRQDQFRIFYNHTIHPELMRLERLRLRLLGLILLSALVLAGLFTVEAFIGEMVVMLWFAIPIAVYIVYLTFRVRRFVQKFKPRIMNLVLDFIDDAPNLGELKYDANRDIPKDIFLQSKLFATNAPVYSGEDSIWGKVGEMDFHLCELKVQELSPVRSGLDLVFKGIFLHAIFSEDTHGQVIIWPRKHRQFLTREVKAFTWEGGENADKEILNEDFKEIFMTYATKATHVAGILSEPMQEAIVRYHRLTGKDIYLSFTEKDIYLAVTEPRDILEPYLFQSNVSFELVRGYAEDIQLLLGIVEDFDKTH